MTFQSHAGPSTKWMLTALAAFCLLSIPGSRTAAAHPHHSTSIAAARALPLGSQITVEGTASTPSGAFASSFFDAGFGMQGDEAGIYASRRTWSHSGRVTTATTAATPARIEPAGAAEHRSTSPCLY